MFDIVRYTPDKCQEWNQFVAQSKNGTFLFYRQYMDYHADRFHDHSLMIYRKSRLYALLPANGYDDVFASHQGLSYGGLVMDRHARAAEILDVFSLLNAYLVSQGFCQVVYKHIPWIYHQLPSEEDLFALTNVSHARLRTRDIASVVSLHCPLSFSSLRKRGVKKAQKGGLVVEESTDFAVYWQLLEDTLRTRHHASPVHSLPEIQLLHSRFPQQIRLFVVKSGQQVIGGTVLYISHHVVKTQYIATNAAGRACGALDLLFCHLLQKFQQENMDYFDFGTSNLVENDNLNAPLIHQKEGFGGRAVCYDTYEWTL